MTNEKKILKMGWSKLKAQDLKLVSGNEGKISLALDLIEQTSRSPEHNLTVTP